MWELRGWSGWKLAVFPCLEILLFLSFPFLWVHPLGVYPPGRVVLFPLFLFQSCVCPLLPLGPSEIRASGLGIRGFLLLLFLSFLKLPGALLPLGPEGYPSPFRIFGVGSSSFILLWVVGLRCTGAGALVCRKAGPAGNLNPNG